MTAFVKTPTLNIAYETYGPTDGIPVILLHGFPDSARAWEGVGIDLSEHGYRAYAPYLRGFMPTTFLSNDTPRSGQTGALMQDVIDFADALDLTQFMLVGHDWGANAAQAVAALHPTRVTKLVSFSPYSLTWDDYQEGPPNYDQIKALWYMNVLQDEMGEGILYGDRRGFASYLWRTWSPSWSFDDETFDLAATSFDHPDYVRVVLSAYRFQPTEHDPRYAEIEAKLSERPKITVPTRILLGKEDGVTLFNDWLTAPSDDFRGEYSVEAFDGVGHFIHREQPDTVVDVIIRDLETKGERPR